MQYYGYCDRRELGFAKEQALIPDSKIITNAAPNDPNGEFQGNAYGHNLIQEGASGVRIFGSKWQLQDL